MESRFSNISLMPEYSRYTFSIYIAGISFKIFWSNFIVIKIMISRIQYMNFSDFVFMYSFIK